MKNIAIFFRSFSWGVIAWTITCKIFKRKIQNKSVWQKLIANKVGIEVGGPSSIFRRNGFLPLYQFMTKLDGINYSNNTIWEGYIDESAGYQSEAGIGKLYIADAVSLQDIKDESYEFLVSCNNLEHIANPLKALCEWKRVLKKDGVLILVLPKKEANFDHRRVVTPLSHLIDDYENNTGEEDLTHLDEILKLHDLKRDMQAGSFESFKKRSADNFSNRSLHHHVFDLNLLKQIISFLEMQELLAYSSKKDHFIAAKKWHN